jgi:hypothetical protein
MLTRSWMHNNHPIDCIAQTPQLLPSTTPPRMGEFRYGGRERFRNHSSHAASNLFPTSHPQVRQHHSHTEQHHGLAIPTQASTFPRSRVEYPRVHNTPGFRPSTQHQELFPIQTNLPPIGTGRPSSFNEDHQSVPATNVVSITSRPLQLSDTFSDPFAKALGPYLKRNESQQKAAGGATDSGLNAPPQRWTSTSMPRRDFPPSQRRSRELAQHGAPNRSGLSARRGSVSSRRTSQGEPQDGRNKPADNTSPRGILKNRRDSSPRKAAVVARAAIAHSARTEVEIKYGEVSPKTTTRSWAQVASDHIKEEPPENNAALQEVPKEACIPIEEDKMEPSSFQTWAQIAAAEWMENKSKQEKLRNESFGKSHSKFGQLKLTAKDQSVKVKGKEEPKEEVCHWAPATRVKQKCVQFEKAPRKHRRARGRGIRTVSATM